MQNVDARNRRGRRVDIWSLDTGTPVRVEFQRLEGGLSVPWEIAAVSIRVIPGPLPVQRRLLPAVLRDGMR